VRDMAVRKLRQSWWIDFRFNHIRYRKRSPLNSRAGALIYEATLRRRLATGNPSISIGERGVLHRTRQIPIRSQNPESMNHKSKEEPVEIELLGVKEVAAFLKVSVSGVRRLQQTRKLPFVKVGGSVRFKKSDLIEYVKRQTIPAIY
jgi:excisionase family DNA binding protein